MRGRPCISLFLRFAAFVALKTICGPVAHSFVIIRHNVAKAGIVYVKPF